MKVKIVIIDSGVKTDHKDFRNKKIEGIVFKNGRLSDVPISDSFGHGTAVYGIISKCDDIADIINIQLSDIQNGLDEDVLLHVLTYVYDNIECDIINLSMGINICDNYNQFLSLCDNFNKKNTIIISAFDNTDSISYPAAFSNVIGVKTGFHCNKINDFEYIDDNVLNIAAKGNIQRVAWTKPDYIMISGNSFACAHVTVETAKFMHNGIKTRTSILEKFKDIAVKKHYFDKSDNKKNKLFHIEKAAVFPFSKEMHSLVRYHDMLPFEITAVYDTKYSAKVGSSTTHILKDISVKDFIVHNISDIIWDNFDTLILGHTNEIEKLTNQNELKTNLIKNALENGKKIYTFDNISTIIQDFHNAEIYYPKIDKNDMEPNRFGMLHRISKPVLGFFGTSSNQGKFTLQLKIRELLIQKGYDVGQIGTEPSSLLYGMDYIFPIGYNNSVYIKEHDVVSYLNSVINNLCIAEKDIILVGGQAGMLPYDIGNVNLFPIRQYNFLLGTQPDAVILCVNPYDELEYITKTINFIESSTDAKVISIVVFPMDVKDDWTSIYGSKEKLSDEKYLKVNNLLNSTFNIPVYILGAEEDMKQLAENTVDYFSQDFLLQNDSI